MAYDTRKMAAYGGAGVVIAVSIILAFFSAPFEEIGMVPIVELESVTHGTLAITIIADTPEIDVKQLMLTIDRLHIKPKNGSWTEVEIPGGRVSFDLLRRQGTFIDATISQLEPGSTVKMHLVQGFEYTNVSLNSGDVVGVDLPNEEIQVITPITMSMRIHIIRG